MEETSTSHSLSPMIISLSAVASAGLWSVIDSRKLHLALSFASKLVTRIIMKPLFRIRSMWELTLVVSTIGTLKLYHRPNSTATLGQCRRAKSLVAVVS